MSQFTEARYVRRLDLGRRKHQLVTDMRFDIGYEGSGLSIRAPAGFITDLGSDPTGILDLTGVAKTAVRSFIVHDLLCENTLFTRLAADAIFLMAMEAEGVPPLWRELIFAAVRTNDSRERHNPDELIFGDVVFPPY